MGWSMGLVEDIGLTLVEELGKTEEMVFLVVKTSLCVCVKQEKRKKKKEKRKRIETTCAWHA